MNLFFSVLLLLLLQTSKPGEISDIPTDSGVYYRQNTAQWIRLQPARIDKMKTKGMDLFLASGGDIGLGTNVVYSGAIATLRIPVSKPIFFVRAVGSSKDAILVRMTQKEDTRTLKTSSLNSSIENRGGFQKGNIRKVAVTEYPDHSFLLTPEQSLSSGEYLLVFGSATSGFDFGIDKAK
jgi:hypothetical protein